VKRDLKKKIVRSSQQIIRNQVGGVLSTLYKTTDKIIRYGKRRTYTYRARKRGEKVTNIQKIQKREHLQILKKFKDIRKQNAMDSHRKHDEESDEEEEEDDDNPK